MSTYTILGITGQVGGSVARALLKEGKKVRGVVRDKAKAKAWEAAGAELAVADSRDAAAMEAALHGAEGVFVMVPPDFAPPADFPETRAILAAQRQALEAARPAKAVFHSSVGAQRTSGLGLIAQSHAMEETMRGLPIPHAFLRAAWFLDNYLWDIPSARDKGEIAAFLDPVDRSFPMVSSEDIGRLAAKALQEMWCGNRILELEGPSRYSLRDAAEAFSRLLGHPVRPVPVPREQWAAIFEAQGTPADRTAPRIAMLDGFNSGWIDFEGGATEHHRGTVTLEKSLRELLKRA